MKKMVRRSTEAGAAPDLLSLVKYLIFACIITAVVLFVLAFLLYKVSLPEKAVSAVIILIYVGATFMAGFLAGKKTGKKRYLWGMIIGLMYFAVIVILSLAGGRAATMFGTDFFTTLLLCVGGGMLGGMLS